MSTTQKDIANKLNLSRSLVAGIINDRPGVRASDETRRRILHAAREMNYRPNAAAKSLRTGKTYTVACVCRSPRNDQAHILYSGVFERLAEGLGTIGHRLLVSVEPNSDALLGALTELATTRSCDAVVLWDDQDQVEQQGELLERHGIPFAVKGRHEIRHPDWPQIDFGHEELMASAVRHLAAAGHRRIAYIGGDSDRLYVLRLREGYQNAMRDLLGEQPDPRLQAALPLSDIRAAERQMQSWLHLPETERPTSLVTGGNNGAWWGVERALYAVGRRIGSDFPMAGMAWGDNILQYGEGVRFEDVSQNHLAEEMVRRVLIPLLQGDLVTDLVVRIVPSLCPMGRMDMDTYYQNQPAIMEMWPPTSA